MLFNEPKLLKFKTAEAEDYGAEGFSALQRAEIAEIGMPARPPLPLPSVSVLFNEPKLLKFEIEVIVNV